MIKTAELEQLTRAFGREIFARIDRTGPFPFSPAWMDERLMEWTMGDEAVKVQLFRFVDVLPYLKTPESITRHLQEYFGEASDRLPGWLWTTVRWLPRRGLMGRALAGMADWSAKRLARKFIAGSNVEEALAAVAALRRRSLAFTVDLLGEATITEAEAVVAQGEYKHLVEGLSREVNDWPGVDLIDRDHEGPLPRVNVSVKLSSLYSQFDPIDPAGTSAAVRERLRPILRAAKRLGAFVNLDMEQHAFKDVTIQIFREVLSEPEFRDWPHCGIAIQAYLRDVETDLRGLLDWVQRRGTPVWIRLVKGAYWDFETIQAAQQGWPVPVWSQKWETDACYERMVRLLLENHTWLRPALASHNIRSLAYAMALARTLDLPPRSFEIQMLYGMADPIKDTFVNLGQRVRVYTPYGELLPGMAYLVRRLLENTANESFLRAGFTERVPEEQLLMNPVDKRGMRNAVSIPAASASERTDPRDPLAGGWDADTALDVEPVTDFSREDARNAMEAAIRQVAGQFGKTYLPIIDGKPVQTTAFVDSINPSHKRQVVGKAGRASADDARKAVAAAGAAFPKWRDTPPEKRADYLFKAAGVMRKRRFELAAWQVHECGKQWREADADVAEAIDFCEFYGREIVRLSRPRRRDVPGEDNYTFYEPRGVAAVIAPWNFPLAILCGMTSAALAAGCPVVMKPAEQSAVNGAKLYEVFREAGMPADVLHLLPGVGEEVGPVLVGHPDVSIIAFTGSRGVGLAINRAAADTPEGQHFVKRVLAEMGGKNAIIVDDDADLDEAIHGVVASAFGYQGQKCSACSRAIVPEGLYDRFVARLGEATHSLKIAPAEDPGGKVGPVIDEEAYNRIRATVEKSKSQGRLVYAGDVGPLAEEGYYIGPHVFADVDPNSLLAREEIFGPVLAVIKSKDLDDALRIANGTAYALTGGLYSRSPANIERVKREFHVGNLYINRKITGAIVDRQPFGGFKLSGVGAKAGGPDYLVQFLLPRTITENTMRRGFAPSAEDDGGL